MKTNFWSFRKQKVTKKICLKLHRFLNNSYYPGSTVWRLHEELYCINDNGSLISSFYLSSLVLSRSVIFFFLTNLFFRERGNEGERKGEKHQCVGCLSCASHQGPGLQPRQVPWLGIEPETLWFAACAQSTALHQPGPVFLNFWCT